jgi:hypothetical protein
MHMPRDLWTDVIICSKAWSNEIFGLICLSAHQCLFVEKHVSGSIEFSVLSPFFLEVEQVFSPYPTTFSYVAGGENQIDRVFPFCLRLFLVERVVSPFYSQDGLVRRGAKHGDHDDQYF